LRPRWSAGERSSPEGWSDELTILAGALAYSLWLALQQAYQPWTTTPRLPALLLEELLHWPAAVVVCLPVLRLIRRVPIERPHRLRRVLVYGALGLMVAAVYQALVERVVAVAPLAAARPAPALRERLLLALTRDQLNYWSLVAVMHALLLRRRARTRALRIVRLEASVAESRLADLEQVLQPDFLLASLRLIGAALDGPAVQARRMIARLADVVRLTQENLRTQSRSVEDQLALAESVLDFARAGLGERLSLRVDVAGAVLGRRIPDCRHRSTLQRTVGLLTAHPTLLASGSLRSAEDGSWLVLEVDIDGIAGERARQAAAALVEAGCPDDPCRPQLRWQGEGKLVVRLASPLEEPEAASAVDLRGEPPFQGIRHEEDPLATADDGRSRGSRRHGAGWWALLGLWTGAMVATALTGIASTGLDLVRFAVYAVVWGAIGLPVLRAAALRYPLSLPRIPAYVVLGIGVSVVCATIIWLAPLGGTRSLAPLVLLMAGNLWTFWLLVALTHLVAESHRHEQARLREARLRRQLASARLQALEMQLRPHFLFNALHSVSALVGVDPEAAHAMLARIEEFLRLSLENAGAPMVPLRDEVRFLRHYLDIQRARFQDRLATDFQVDPEASAGLVPNLILQPIVENAIRHGIAPRPHGGRVCVWAKRRGDRLELAVEDDGIGGGPGFDESRFGFGLSNTRARLRLLYGEDHRFLVKTGERDSFAVVLDVPFRPAADTTQGAAPRLAPTLPGS